jgi:ribonuclease P protein component
MISQRHRFHGFGGLRPVYRHGQTVRGSQMSLKFLDRQPGRPFRAAVVVSRQVSPSAVVRNRIRRRVYETVRQTDSKLTAERDLVLTVFSDQLANMDATQLKALVTELLVKATKAD